MYVTLNRADGKIFLTYYDGNCGYFIDDTEENQVLLSFPSHMRYKNKVNLDDDFMRSLWRVLKTTPGRLRLITNALVDIKNGVKLGPSELAYLVNGLSEDEIPRFRESLSSQVVNLLEKK